MKRLTKFTKAFKKDYKKLMRSGVKIEKLDAVMFKLTYGEKLEATFDDHELQGNWRGFRDCHIQGDWILIYKIDRTANGHEMIIFERTGNHSNIFG